MTNGCGMLLLTIILKFRKQMVTLTTAFRHEAQSTSGGGRLGGSGLLSLCGLSGVAAVPNWLLSQRKEGHNEMYSH